ncbi:MAG TPA: hypothetical protein VEK80_18055 [Kribbellaceae bacterium]|nr:hypothetical protein [Kribbellaceae bacterium]
MGIELDPLLPEIAELCADFGVAELAVFGSAARGEDTPVDSRVLYASAGPFGHRNAVQTFSGGRVITEEDVRSLDDE